MDERKVKKQDRMTLVGESFENMHARLPMTNKEYARACYQLAYASQGKVDPDFMHRLMVDNYYNYPGPCPSREEVAFWCSDFKREVS